MTSPSSPGEPIVLYLAGAGRSGSTVLANALGQIDGWFSAGEVRYVWTRGMAENRLCGCGRRFSECAVWDGILSAAFRDSGVDERRVASQLERIAGLRNVPKPLAGTRSRTRLARELGDLPTVLDRLYRGIAAATGSRVVVDSSKLPTYGWVLDELTSLDVRIVHLVRDPRATTYSWLRPKPLNDGARSAEMHSHGAVMSSILWTTLNLASARLWPQGSRHLRLRYEDFVEVPRDALTEIAALGGEICADLPLADEHTLRLEPTHTVAGNPDRLSHGPTTLRLDERWRTGLPPSDRRLVTALTAPVRNRFGY